MLVIHKKINGIHSENYSGAPGKYGAEDYKKGNERVTEDFCLFVLSVVYQLSYQHVNDAERVEGKREFYEDVNMLWKRCEKV